MTTCVYCRKDINSDGEYEPFDCPKLKNTNVYWKDICEYCRYYIEGGKEVPAP